MTKEGLGTVQVCFLMAALYVYQPTGLAARP